MPTTSGRSPAVIAACVRGASHKRNGRECQDSWKLFDCGEGCLALAVADGHGSSSCPYSKTGSLLAANSCGAVLKKLALSYGERWEALHTYLHREGDTKVAQVIQTEWKRRVLRAHKRAGRPNEGSSVVKMYGTTLLGVLITPLFVFALQIGDGDITWVDKRGARPFLQADKILGVETHSLSKDDAWKKAVTTVYRRDSSVERALLLVSTDGFSNSFRDQGEYYRTCGEYCEAIRSYGLQAVGENLRAWLEETSAQGCGDDITLALVEL